MSARTSPPVSEVMMRNVRLALPEEIMRDAGIPYAGLRDIGGIALAIDGINLSASIVTLATLKQYAPQLAAALRRWRLKQDHTPVTLVVKGDCIDLKIDLSPIYSTKHLLRQLDPLLDKDTYCPASYGRWLEPR